MKARRWLRRLLVALGVLTPIAALVSLPPGTFGTRPPLVEGPPPAPFVPGKTNVALIVLCTARADQMTPYGGPATTPFIDTLARAGTRFDANISQAPWTKPSIAAIVTGRPSGELGITDPSPNADDQRVPEAAVTLAERLKSQGYATVGGTSNPNVNEIFGFAQGIDAYYEATELWREGQRMVRGSDVVDEVVRRLPAAKPWYAQVVLTDVHLPYRLDATWWRWWSLAPSTRVAQYRSMMTRLDTAVFRFVQAIEARGEREDTLFVVIGDHGEGLYLPHHHGYSHGHYLYPSAVRVPLLISGPGVAAGRVARALTASIDVVPTILKMAGLADPDLPGVTHQLDGGPIGGGREVYVETYFRKANRAAIYSEDTMCQADFDPVGTKARADEDSPAFPTACFAWRDDMDATTEVQAPGLMGRVLSQHAEMAARRAAWVKHHGESRAVVGQDTKDALKSLGYVE